MKIIKGMNEPMKTYPFNRTSRDGRRVFKLLDMQFNKAALDNETNEGKTFVTHEVPSVLQCRANKIGFLFSSNLSGIKRPQVRIEADVELAWGDFPDGVTTLDFTHGQELPITYVQPLEDDTLKMLIDAGLYRDERFEELMSKLILDEEFDADADMVVSHLDVSVPSEQGVDVPVLLVDPVNVVHEDYDTSEHTTIASMIQRSAKLAIDLHSQGVKTDDLVREDAEKAREVYIDDAFKDVVAQSAEEQIVQEVDDTFKTSSELLDQEIDVTDKLKGSLTYDHTSEDDRIRELKLRERTEGEAMPASSTVAVAVQDAPVESKTKLVESLDLDGTDALFPDISGDYEYEDESEDGPEL